MYSFTHNDTYVYRSERMNTTHLIGGRVFSRRLITASISAPHPYFLRKIFLYPSNPARLQRPDRFYPALRLPWHSHYHPRPALACLCHSHAISTCFPSLRCAELTIWAKKRDEARWLSEGFCTADFRWLIDNIRPYRRYFTDIIDNGQFGGRNPCDYLANE